LGKQPDAVRTLLEGHTAGLKSALDKERAARKKKDDEVAAADLKRKQAELSETERLKAQLGEAEKAKLQAEARASDLAIRHAVELAATKLKFHRPEDAYALMDLSGVSIGDDGKVAGVDETLKALVKERAYLVDQGGSAPDTDAAKRGSGKGVTEAERIAAWRELGLTHAVRAATATQQTTKQ
jgi:sRNA-binding protein